MKKMAKQLSFTVAYRHVESNTQTTHTYDKIGRKTTNSKKIHAIKILFTSMPKRCVILFSARKVKRKEERWHMWNNAHGRK